MIRRVLAAAAAIVEAPLLMIRVKQLRAERDQLEQEIEAARRAYLIYRTERPGHPPR